MEKAVLFDLDGTLADTLPDLAAATNAALRENGFPECPLGDYPHMVGNGARLLVQRALHEAATDDTVEQVLASFLRIYDELCLREVRLYPGIDETVRRLHEAGYHLLVVTNKPQQQADKIVRHFFGDTLFEGVYGGGSAYPKKPDPTSAQLALRQVNADPAASWFVGDSDVDVLTAKAAHLRCVGAAWGFRGEAELRRAGADAVAMTAADILPCILADRCA